MLATSSPEEKPSRDGQERVVEEERTPSPVRLESFSDNVISVIITIMVLGLRLPARDGLGGLREMTSTIGIYLLSFSFTAVYWLNHQQVTRRLQAAGYYFQIANLAFLFCLSLLPFSTSYLISRHTTSYGVQQYATTLLLTAIAFYFVRQAMHLHLWVHDRMTPSDLMVNRRHRFSLLVYLLCIFLATWHPRLAVFVLGCNTAVWGLPGIDRRLLRIPKLRTADMHDH